MTSEYFMDSMAEWEVIEFYDVINYADYVTWEQTRLLLSCYVDHKKVKKLSDIMKFPWDNDRIEKSSDTNISNEDIERLKKMAQQISKNMT